MKVKIKNKSMTCILSHINNVDKEKALNIKQSNINISR